MFKNHICKTKKVFYRFELYKLSVKIFFKSFMLIHHFVLCKLAYLHLFIVLIIKKSSTTNSGQAKVSFKVQNNLAPYVGILSL